MYMYMSYRMDGWVKVIFERKAGETGKREYGGTW